MEAGSGGGGPDREKEKAKQKDVDQSLSKDGDGGKEQASDRERDRERLRQLRDRALAAVAAGGLHDDEGMGSLTPRNLSSASNALNGLLRKLGAGIDDFLPSTTSASAQGGRLKGILGGLQAEGEEGRQLEALSQLCELLSIGTEESLSSFSVDSFVPALVGLLNCEYNPDIMLLAARALTHLCDVLPSSCAAVVHYQAVPSFCARLLTIEYIDLAEQSLQALEKISHEHPTAILRAGGLMAVLSYLDFFSTGVQRVAVSTAANICRQLPSDGAEFVMDAVPILTNLLQYPDFKVVEHACGCLTRIAESLAASPEKIDLLCSHGLITQAVRLVSAGSSAGSQTPLSPSTYTGLIRLLAVCARGSAAAAQTLLQSGISRTIRDILTASSSFASSSATSSAGTATIIRPSEQLYEIVSLINELLPPMVDAGASASRVREPVAVGAVRGPRHSGRDTSVKQEGEAVDPKPGPRERLLADQPDLVMQMGTDLFPVLIQVYVSSVNPGVRHKCLAAMIKLLHFSSVEMLQNLLRGINVSSFVAGAIASKDVAILTSGLQMAEILMLKLPDVFSKAFVKEGVLHALDVLLVNDVPAEATAAAASALGAISLHDGRRQPQPEPATRPRTRTSTRSKGAPAGEEGPPAREHGSGASPPRPPPGGGSKASPPRASQRQAALARARAFRSTYFPGGAGSSQTASESLLKLQQLCARLRQDPAKSRKGKAKWGQSGVPSEAQEKRDFGVVVEILRLISGEDGVSTFEFIGSGVVEALLDYFSLGGSWEDSEGVQRVRERALERLRKFVEVALPSHHAPGAPEPPMVTLVHKLQGALASLEHFPVVLSQTARPGHGHGGSSSVSAGLSALSQPFKLRLVRASHDKLLRDYSSNVVLIEPLATLAAVEDFLWPRVKRSDPAASAPLPAAPPPPSADGAAPSRPDASAKTASASAPSSAAAPPDNPSTPHSRPVTRALRAAALADAPSPVSPSTGPGTRPPRKEGGSEAGDLAASRKKAATSSAEHSGPVTRAAHQRAAEAAAAEEAAATSAASADPSSDVHTDGRAKEAAGSSAHFSMDEDMMSEDEDDDAEDDHDEQDEDDAVDDGDDDDDEVLGDDAPVACGPERVHDVQLPAGEGVSVGPAPQTVPAATGEGEPAPPKPVGSASKAAAGPSSSSLHPPESAAAMRQSFAQALAGWAGGGGSSVRAGLAAKDAARQLTAAAPAAAPKLRFTLRGTPLSRDSTIFRAIQQQAMAGREEEEDEEEEEERAEAGGEFGAPGSRRRLWDDIYTIAYTRVDAGPDAATPAGSGGREEDLSSPSRVAPHPCTPLAALLDLVLSRQLPCSLDKSVPTYSILLLLRILEALNRLAFRLQREAAGEDGTLGQVADTGSSAGIVAASLVPQDAFVSSKLTPKLARQLQDVLALCSGGLPPWCQQLASACQFLFPLDVRRQYFHCTALGLSRALQRLQQQQAAGAGVSPLVSTREARELRVGRLQRQKVRVSRQRILESATKVMELYAAHKAVLEVEYFGEVGTGLGPTLEFYTLMSQELQRASLQMWRTDPDIADEAGGAMEAAGDGASSDRQARAAPPEGGYVHAPCGLFPRPYPPRACSGSSGAAAAASQQDAKDKVVEHFRLLGRAMAKALQDNRLLDLPLSTPFYKLVVGKELDLFDIRGFDPRLGATLEELHALAKRRKHAHQAAREPATGAGTGTLLFRGLQIEDLCLDFTLPGQPDYLLKPKGNDIMVTLRNLEEYVEAVVDASVGSGIAPQVAAFREGFNQVFDLNSLRVFGESELDALLCGRQELWTVEALVEHLKFDHGYTASSPPIQNLLEILGELAPDEQRAFLKFVTGAPRLPPGGLAALTPKLTIVRKHPSCGGNGAISGVAAAGPALGLGTVLADGDLPSVMTCANYLKLPPYSCKAVMRERLLYAIIEGQGSFDLS